MENKVQEEDKVKTTSAETNDSGPNSVSSPKVSVPIRLDPLVYGLSVPEPTIPNFSVVSHATRPLNVSEFGANLHVDRVFGNQVVGRVDLTTQQQMSHPRWQL